MKKIKATKSKYLRGKDNSDAAQRLYHERKEKKYEALSVAYSRIVSAWNGMLKKTDSVATNYKKESMRIWKRSHA